MNGWRCVKMTENQNSQNEDRPIVWRNIERVPFARWDDLIEKTEDEWGKI